MWKLWLPTMSVGNPAAKRQLPFGYLLMSLSMVAVPYREGCIILSLTAGLLSVSHSNGKMPTLFLHTSKRVTEHNVATVVASPFSL